MNRIPVESQLLTDIAHEGDVLEVTFKKTGARYRYEGVSPEAFAALQAAKSVGGHFLANIRPTFTGVRLEEDRDDAR
jgi:KTSC domain